jgi:hypothetical protein
MSTKRFRALQLWHNTLVMVWCLPFAILPGVIAGASSGNFFWLFLFCGLCVVGLFLAYRRDTAKKCTYVLEGDKLVIADQRGRTEIWLLDISDATLLDRSGARAYLGERQAQLLNDPVERSRAAKEFLRHCSVDIGLKSYTFGLLTRMIDRLPNAKNDLVLLRTKYGGHYLLSPIHSQDMVESLSRRRLQLSDPQS